MCGAFCFLSRLLLLVSLLIPSITLAQSGNVIERFALLIGNWDYNRDGIYSPDPPEVGLRDLRNPCNDAMTVGARLQLAGWNEEDIDVRCNLTLQEMHGAISRFINRFQNSNEPMALLYFSGHGAQVRNRNYLFSVDASPNLPKVAELLAKNGNATLFLSDAVDLSSKVLRETGDVTSGALLIVLDACRDDPLVNHVAKIGKVTVPAASLPLQLLPGIVISYSTGDGAVADDGIGETSPFAEAFSASIREYVSIDDIISEASTIVSKATKGYSWQQYPDKKGYFLQPPKRCLGPCTPARVASGLPETSVPNSVRPNEGLDRKAMLRVQYLGGSAGRLVAQAVTPPGAFAERRPVEQERANGSSSRTVYEVKPVSGNPDDSVVLDVFWCDGDLASVDRQILASEIAAAATVLAKTKSNISKTSLTRIRTRPLPIGTNSRLDYSVDTNVMEVGAGDQRAMEWARAIVSVSSVPLPIRSSRIAATPGYLKAFVCGDVNLQRADARLFVQIARPSQEKNARSMLQNLRNSVSSLQVADWIDIKASSLPAESEVKYYFTADKSLAEEIAAFAGKVFGTPVLVRGFERQAGKTAPGTIELLLGTDWVERRTASRELKRCRLPEHGVENWRLANTVTRSSNWRGGGGSQPGYCLELAAEVRQEFASSTVVEVKSSSETTRDSCAPFRCIQYQYTCSVVAKNDPIYKEAESESCP